MTYEEFKTELTNSNICMEELPRLLVQTLEKRGVKIAAAESCTGGLISKLITDVSGASLVFDCGVCSYANEIKERVLGVSHEALVNYGAVSSQVAMEMAQGVRKLAKAELGIATTGIAGPTGGTAEKPVGTVYIGVSTMAKNYAILANLATKNATRDNIRQSAAHLAIYCGFKALIEENY